MAERPHEYSSAEKAKMAKKDLEIIPLAPNRTYWIVPHSSFKTHTQILDVTGTIATPYTGEISDTYKAEAEMLSRSSPPAPTFLITKDGMGRHLQFQSSSGAPLFEWHSPFFSFGRTTLAYAPNAAIEMKPRHCWQRDEPWEQGGVAFRWEMDKKIRSNHMTLYQVIGTRKIQVAKYRQSWGSWTTGGVLLLDARQVDPTIAVLTCCVMLKKMRMRLRERVLSNILPGPLIACLGSG